MEVVFRVAFFGVIAALATIGMFALARVALPGLRDWWTGRRESARAMRRPVLRTARAARYTSPTPRRPLVPVMDPAIRATPVRSPEQIHWSMAVRGAGTAVDGAGPVGGNGIGGGAAAAGGDAGMDVEGHGVAAFKDKLDADLSDYPVVEAQRAYWQTNGSTDCTGCPSSRSRGAAFCLRCGRRLRGNADAESIAAASAADVRGDRYDLDWVATRPDDPAVAVSMLENRLETEAQPVGRHFLFAQFESYLYSMRDQSGALERFDETCALHHAEMGAIAPALVEVFGGMPLLELYKQAVIRRQKAHDWARAVEWAERGIATYADHALNPADVEDLRVRLNKALAKLEQAATPRQPRAPRAKATDERPPAIETLVCQSCGRSWERQRVRGRKPHYCPDCTVTAGRL